MTKIFYSTECKKTDVTDVTDQKTRKRTTLFDILVAET